VTSFEKVLVTGGAGLIGSHIVDLLMDGRDAGTYGDIVILDNFVRGVDANIAGARARGPLTVIDGDIRDRDAVRRAMDGVDLVFHLAAIRITQCAEDPRLAMEVLGDGTFNVIEAAAAANVRKVVASSSASVYGLAEEFPTTERHHPYNNRTLYGALKVLNEGLLRSFNDMTGLPYVALRYFNVYGPRMDIYGAYTEVLIRWMERLEAGDGLRVCDRHCSRQRARRAGRCLRRGVQRRQWHRDQPRGACGIARECHGQGAPHRTRA
jgi:UDP-glucose 4-epimerase